jgi:hypothetical protein
MRSARGAAHPGFESSSAADPRIRAMLYLADPMCKMDAEAGIHSDNSAWIFRRHRRLPDMINFVLVHFVRALDLLDQEIEACAKGKLLLHGQGFGEVSQRIESLLQ